MLYAVLFVTEKFVQTDIFGGVKDVGFKTGIILFELRDDSFCFCPLVTGARGFPLVTGSDGAGRAGVCEMTGTLNKMKMISVPPGLDIVFLIK